MENVESLGVNITDRECVVRVKGKRTAQGLGLLSVYRRVERNHSLTEAGL